MITCYHRTAYCGQQSHRHRTSTRIRTKNQNQGAAPSKSILAHPRGSGRGVLRGAHVTPRPLLLRAPTHVATSDAPACVSVLRVDTTAATRRSKDQMARGVRTCRGQRRTGGARSPHPLPPRPRPGHTCLLRYKWRACSPRARRAFCHACLFGGRCRARGEQSI